MKAVHRSYVLLHLSIILWGFTAIIGALITLSSGALVWWRVGITSVILFLWPRIRRELFGLSLKMITNYAWIGVMVAVHWVCFFASVKYANASIALITMSMTALFTAFIEPVILKYRINRLDIGLSILVIPAMALTMYEFEENMIVGFWLGIVAAFLLAYFTVLNRKLISGSSPETITFIEMAAAWLFLSILAPFFIYFQPDLQLLPNSQDLLYLSVLSIACTILPFILHLEALKHISAFATNLVINLEPVYGLILAIFILREHKELNTTFYIGASIIIGIVMAYPFVIRKQSKL